MASTPPAGHIFISYRQTEPDKQFAHRLAYDLQAAGHPVWIDVQGIEAGHDWNTEIQRALDGCYAYLVILTPEAMASRWVRNELLYALAEKVGSIYPVMLIDVKLPPELISIQYVDFRDNYGKALAELIAHLPVPPSSGISPLAKPGIKLEEAPPRRRVPVGMWLAGLAALALIIGLGVLLNNGAQASAQLTQTAAQLAQVTRTQLATLAPTPSDTPQPSATPSPTPPATSTPLGSSTGRIAFASSRADPNVAKCGSNCNLEIYFMNPDGSGLTRLTENPASDGFPTWSPDGTQIAFVSLRNGDSEIFAIAADGSGFRNVTRNLGNDYNPAWSPDGTRIAFDSTRSGNEEVYIMNANGSGQTRLTSNKAIDSSPAWSPDGSQIAFVSNRDGNQEIYVMKADGSGQTRVTTNAANDYAPAWSPDGKRIAFVSARDGNAQVYVMAVDGSEQINLSNSTSNDRAPAWSPDGSRIAFESDSDGSVEIFAMNADGTGVTNLTNNPAGNYSPSWTK